MTRKGRRNHWIARAVVAVGLITMFVIGAFALSATRHASDTNKKAIAEIQASRKVNSILAAAVDLKLCLGLQAERARSRQTIRESPASLAAAFSAAGVPPARVQQILELRRARRNKLLNRYPPISCAAVRALAIARTNQ